MDSQQLVKPSSGVGQHPTAVTVHPSRRRSRVDRPRVAAALRMGLTGEVVQEWLGVSRKAVATVLAEMGGSTGYPYRGESRDLAATTEAVAVSTVSQVARDFGTGRQVIRNELAWHRSALAVLATDREQVTGLVAAGVRLKEIAGAFGLDRRAARWMVWQVLPGLYPDAGLIAGGRQLPRGEPPARTGDGT